MPSRRRPGIEPLILPVRNPGRALPSGRDVEADQRQHNIVQVQCEKHVQDLYRSSKCHHLARVLVQQRPGLFLSHIVVVDGHQQRPIHSFVSVKEHRDLAIDINGCTTRAQLMATFREQRPDQRLQLLDDHYQVFYHRFVQQGYYAQTTADDVHLASLVIERYLEEDLEAHLAAPVLTQRSF